MVRALAGECRRRRCFPPTSFPTSRRFAGRGPNTSASVRALVDELGEDGVARVIPYTLLSGVASASPFWQMLQHVVNHASYHRGQVTTMLRQLGAAPAKSCDMITFYRELGAK